MANARKTRSVKEEMIEVNSTSNIENRQTINLKRKKRLASISPECAESSHVNFITGSSFFHREILILKYPPSPFFCSSQLGQASWADVLARAQSAKFDRPTISNFTPQRAPLLAGKLVLNSGLKPKHTQTCNNSGKFHYSIEVKS